MWPKPKYNEQFWAKENSKEPMRTHQRSEANDLKGGKTRMMDSSIVHDWLRRVGASFQDQSKSLCCVSIAHDILSGVCYMFIHT